MLCLLPAAYLVKEKPKYKGTEELNKKYWAFRRNDIDNWTLWRLTINNIIFLFPIRMAIAWGSMFFFCLWVCVVMIGQSREEKIAKWRVEILKNSIKPFALIWNLMCGVVAIF